MSMATVWTVALLGAVCGLDTVSFPQAMISRPIVAATVAGAVAGSPLRGLAVGALLELFALKTLPFGASRYPEWGSAAVVGGTLAAQFIGPDAIGLAACVAVLTAALGGLSMVWHRSLVGRWAASAHPRCEAGEVGAVVGLQLAGIGADFVRGGAVATASFLLAAPALQLVASKALTARALIVGPGTMLLGGAVAGAAVWKVTHGTPRALWYLAAGIASASLLMAVL